MKLYIWTQVLENYGDAEKPHWKAKGGGEYFVPGVTTENLDKALALVLDDIGLSNEYFQEYVRGWDLVEDDFMTQFERDQLEYDGRIAYPATVLEINTEI